MSSSWPKFFAASTIWAAGCVEMACARSKPNSSPLAFCASTTPSVTSYLCTDGARAIYEAGAADFASLAGRLAFGAWSPPGSGGQLTNAQACTNAQAFLAYAQAVGNRGTPHRV